MVNFEIVILVYYLGMDCKYENKYLKGWKWLEIGRGKVWDGGMIFF